ncbi:FG-GAP and VCBS repeat-containing protein [Streptomyces sp. 8N616]|uniref:FG-GAP and VCBS repeat-containing protein n=1 Tax=Streptomyces sp. 8N616 TaxID=3457414 RepID=UPI003FD3EA4E
MHKRFRTAGLATATATALTGGLLAVTAGVAAAAPSGLHGDFNGDGYRDVAVSAAGASVGGRSQAGQLIVQYGSATGLSAAKRTVISQNSTGVPGTAEAGDYFGADTAYGDFNADGYADIATGAAGEDVDGDTDGGTVVILWGSAAGLSGGTTVPDPTPTQHDRFGRGLEAADFNGDGKADLAIGSSSATLQIYRGGFAKSGTTGGRYTVTPAILGGGDTGPLNLTSGDVNGDLTADLVVDGYEAEPSGENHWNANYYVPGSASGLDASGAVKLPAGIITAIGDTDSDGYGDIVIGMSWDSEVPGSSTGGKVNVVHGSASGPSGEQTTITQNTEGVPGSSETEDGFGNELSLGDINGDGHLDLAIGAYGESLDGIAYTGAVTVVYGSAAGLDPSAGSQFFSQNTAGVPGSNEAEDLFGSDVQLADVNGDGKADLTVGAGGENGGNGAVTGLLSDGTGIGTTGAVSLSPSAVGVSTTGSPGYGWNFAN